MTGNPRSDALFKQAEQALSSARTLLNAADANGACNRAYYAMFSAARAALIASRAPVKRDIGKTHSGIITAFSQNLIKDGDVSTEMGRLFKRAHQMRLIADYKGDPIELRDVQQIVIEAETFVCAMQTKFATKRNQQG